MNYSRAIGLCQVMKPITKRAGKNRPVMDIYINVGQ